MTIDEYIGRRIRRRRVILGLTQGELAVALGAAHQTVSKFEVGHTRLSVARLYDLARALEAPIDYFVDGFDSGAGRASNRDAAVHVEALGA